MSSVVTEMSISAMKHDHVSDGHKSFWFKKQAFFQWRKKIKYAQFKAFL